MVIKTRKAQEMKVQRDGRINWVEFEEFVDEATGEVLFSKQSGIGVVYPDTPTERMPEGAVRQIAYVVHTTAVKEAFAQKRADAAKVKSTSGIPVA